MPVRVVLCARFTQFVPLLGGYGRLVHHPDCVPGVDRAWIVDMPIAFLAVHHDARVSSIAIAILCADDE